MAGLKDYLKDAAKDAISKVASEGIDAARNAATVFLNINNSPYSGFMKFL